MSSRAKLGWVRSCFIPCRQDSGPRSPARPTLGSYHLIFNSTSHPRDSTFPFRCLRGVVGSTVHHRYNYCYLTSIRTLRCSILDTTDLELPVADHITPLLSSKQKISEGIFTWSFIFSCILLFPFCFRKRVFRNTEWHRAELRQFPAP